MGSSKLTDEVADTDVYTTIFRLPEFSATAYTQTPDSTVRSHDTRAAVSQPVVATTNDIDRELPYSYADGADTATAVDLSTAKSEGTPGNILYSEQQTGCPSDRSITTTGTGARLRTE